MCCLLSSSKCHSHCTWVTAIRRKRESRDVKKCIHVTLLTVHKAEWERARFKRDAKTTTFLHGKSAEKPPDMHEAWREKSISFSVLCCFSIHQHFHDGILQLVSPIHWHNKSVHSVHPQAKCKRFNYGFFGESFCAWFASRFDSLFLLMGERVALRDRRSRLIDITICFIHTPTVQLHHRQLYYRVVAISIRISSCTQMRWSTKIIDLQVITRYTESWLLLPIQCTPASYMQNRSH